MFVSTRDQGSTRRSRAYGINKTARSSRLSVLSSASTSSRGSTATVTQESYSKAQDHNGRTKRRRRIHHGSTGDDSYERSVLDKPLGKEKKRSVDVFDFLVDEAARRNAGDTTPDPSSVERQDESIIESDPECYYRTQLSDSGISMGSSNGEPMVPDSPNSAPLPTLLEDPYEPAYSSASSVAGCACCQQETQLGWSQYDDARFHGEHAHSSQATQASFFIPSNPFLRPNLEDAAADAQTSKSLASSPIIFRDKSGSRSTPRLFRRFKRINSRVLLQMQANIAELEYAIKIIDAKDTAKTAEMESKTGTKPNKAFRPSRDEQARRAVIYQELRANLDQYYQALIATHQVELLTKPPTVAETQSFQKWVKSHILNKGKTSELISEESDLVCFNPPAVRESPLSTFRIIALSAFINVLMPLIFYKLLSGILNRLILWSIVIGSGAITMERLGMKAERIYTTCIIAFGSISLGAALSS